MRNRTAADLAVFVADRSGAGERVAAVEVPAGEVSPSEIVSAPLEAPREVWRGPSASAALAGLLAGEPAALERRVSWRLLREAGRERGGAGAQGGELRGLWAWLVALDGEGRLELLAGPVCALVAWGWLEIRLAREQRRFVEAVAAWCRVN